MNDAATETRSSARSLIFWIMVFSISYSVLRYHVVGPVPWKDFPFFILNKGISLSAFLLLAMNFGLGPAKNLGFNVPAGFLNARMAMGIAGFLLVLIHVLMSLMLFSPAVYGKFFDANSTLTFTTGVSMLFGVIAFVVLWGYNLSFKTNLREDKAFIAFITSRKFLLWALPLGAMHLLFMGYSGWLNPGGWHGGLPPISLVSFVAFACCYALNLFGRK